MTVLTKQRYQRLLSTGVFVRYSPERLDQLHKEVRLFLEAHSGSLDASELFDIYELQFYLLLFTHHDVEAKLYLDRFNDQFGGKKSQKLAIMRSMYYEAIGENDLASKMLQDDPDELRSSRRLMTLSRRKEDGLEDTAGYIKSLNFYLTLQACDAMAWAELGEVYHSVGDYEKAVYCFKEVLLQEPNAYNIFYKAGMSLYYQLLAITAEKLSRKDMLQKALPVLEHSRDCFLRSVEISESYVKGWVGAYIVTSCEYIDQLLRDKASSGVATIEKCLIEAEKIKKLSRSQIKKLEHLDTDEEFEAFLRS